MKPPILSATDQLGPSMHRFARHTAYAAALLLITTVCAAFTLTSPAHAAGSVQLAVAGTPVAGRTTTLTATVKPRAKGRTVIFSVKNGKKWKKLGAAKTDKAGKAALRTKKLKAGSQTVRAVASKHQGQKQQTATKKVQVRASAHTSGKAATLAAPAQVYAGSVFEFTIDVSAVANGVLVITAPAKGNQVRRAGDVEIRNGTARIDLDTVLAADRRTVMVRWQAPDAAAQLEIRANLTGDGVSDRLSTSVEVVKNSPDNLPNLDHDVEIFSSGGDLPQDGEDLIVLCMPGPARAIPSYADVLKQVDAWVEGQFLPGKKAMWNSAPELKTSAGAHKVFAQAYLDNRVGAMMAAAVAGHRLAPKDARHLSNAAMTANMIRKPEWAVALAQKAAGLSPNTSGGLATEAARLNNLGHAWAQMSNFSKAESSLRTAIRLQPENPLLRRELGAILSCAKQHDEALTQMREAYRTSTEPDEVVVGDDYTQTDPDRAFDMSQAVAGELALFDIPSTMERLIGLGGRDGIIGADEDALDEHYNWLFGRRLQLEAELRERKKSMHPAEERRIHAVLKRMNQTASKDVLALYEELRDVWSESGRTGLCKPGMFDQHPWCNIDEPPTNCGQHRQFSEVWSQRESAFRQAIIAYHEMAWPTWTGLRGNLSDPVAHELAGVLMELEMNFWASAIVSDLREVSERLSGFNYSAEGLPPRGTCTNPEPMPAGASTETKVEGEEPPLCSDSMKPWALEASILIATMKVNCEKVAFELSTPPVLLAAFAKVEFDFNPQGWIKSSRLVAGVKLVGEAPGANLSGEAAFYLEQDTSGKLTDVGFTSGTELELGHTVKLTADEAKSKWSFMNATDVY